MDTCAHVGWPVFAHVGPAVDQQLGSLGVFNCQLYRKIFFLQKDLISHSLEDHGEDKQ